MRRTWAFLALIGCGGGGGDTGAGDPPTDQGACGDVLTGVPVTVTGRVVLPGGDPAAGATVTLEERSWDAGITEYGTATADAAGAYSVDASLTVVEGCWGAAISYYVVATLDAATGEMPVNSFLFNAVDPEAMDPDGVAEVADLTLE